MLSAQDIAESFLHYKTKRDPERTTGILVLWEDSCIYLSPLSTLILVHLQEADTLELQKPHRQVDTGILWQKKATSQ